MPTLVAKINRVKTWLPFTGALLWAAVLAMAQDQSSSSTPPSSSTEGEGKAGGNAPQATGGKTSETGSSSSNPSPLEYLFHRKPQEGTAAKEGMDANRRFKDKAIAQEALGGGRIEDAQMRARFEKYLGMAEVSQEQLKAYADDMNKVLTLLRGNKTVDAWKELHKLAGYQSIDAGVSWELANRVESIWNADKTSWKMDHANEKLQRDVDVASRNADVMSDSLRRKDLEYQRRLKDTTKDGKKNQPQQQPQNPNGGVPQANDEGGGGGTYPPAAPPSDSMLGKLELTQEYLRSLEAKAKIKMNELKAQKLFDKAKANFAEYITMLYQSGRHRHVLIAADFWRRIFDEGEYPVSMAQQVNASLEICRDVENSIEVFQHRMDEKEVAAATDRLQEAFMLSEFQPSVLGLKRSDKKKVDAFMKRLNRMQNMIEARDFAGLETLLEEMKTIAPDFDTTKPVAMVNAVKLESQLRLGKAKLAAQQGDLKRAMEEFQSAAEAWPGNPDLKDKALAFFDTQDVQTQSLTEFDRLVTENNYRAIFEKQLMFAPAMKDDKKRQEQLKGALEKVKVAEMALEKATLMRAAGDVFGAWETVELAIQDLPSDIKLNTLRGELAGKGAEFVAAINRAKEAEARQELGYSLTWYAIAQRYYPASRVANQAIEKLSKEIIAKASL